MAVCSNAATNETVAIAPATKETKDKRQINHQTRVVPLGHHHHIPTVVQQQQTATTRSGAGIVAIGQPQPTQTIYGHHTVGQYVTQPGQGDQQTAAAISPQQLDQEVTIIV